MTRSIQKAAVLGAGTMGARIAAHFANAGLPCILLDIVPPDLKPDAPGADRNKVVRAGLDAAKKSRPAAFFTAALAEKISIGNFDDDLSRVAEADWIIEVVAENLEIKRKLLSRVAQFRKPGAIVTTNTSGLPVHLIAEGMPEAFQQHWAGTHFFNPPRYLKLVEVIPGPKTLPDVLATLTEFCDRRLGKGVVPAKDSPNFIANRIAVLPSAGPNPPPSAPRTSSVSTSSFMSSKIFTKPRLTTNPANFTKSLRSSKKCSSARCSATKPARVSTKE